MRVYYLRRYVAVELCICSVEDFFKTEKRRDPDLNYDDLRLNKLGVKQILMQSTEGLAYLHESGFIHRNLKPSNFLIASYHSNKVYKVKITDFRKSKDFVEEKENSGTTGSKGWVAPECFDSLTLRESVDVFNLGMYYYYVLFGGIHPFSEDEQAVQLLIQKEDNVMYNPHWENHAELEKNYKEWWEKDADSFKNEQLQEVARKAICLIQKMIKYHPTQRASLKEVTQDAFFQPGIGSRYAIYTRNSQSADGVRPGLLLIFNQAKFINKVRLNLLKLSVSFFHIIFSLCRKMMFPDLKLKNRNFARIFKVLVSTSKYTAISLLRALRKQFRQKLKMKSCKTIIVCLSALCRME